VIGAASAALRTVRLADGRVHGRAPGRRGHRRPYDASVSPFWIWMQALIVLCVIASIVIATVKLV
jgi:hypothetical protein